MTVNLTRLSAYVSERADYLEREPDRPHRATDQILHLAELVPIVRERLEIDAAFPDDATLAGLRAITAKSHNRARWKAAFNSNLGHWLALRSTDLNASLNNLISLLPPPRS